MWNKFKIIPRNSERIKSITYLCEDEDLGVKKVSRKERHRKAYAKIFQAQATVNMKERLKQFNHIQTQLNNENKQNDDKDENLEKPAQI